MNTREYINSDRGRLSRYRWRAGRRVRFIVRGIEPASKKAMPRIDKIKFQRAVEQHLAQLHRRAFRGPVVLSLAFFTSSKRPSHIHTIAKNILDLLATTIPETRSRRKALVYQDDSQVWGLTVSCRHGEVEPLILGKATSLRDFLADLDLAEHIRRDTNADYYEDWDWHDDPVDELRRVLRNEKEERQLWGRAYESRVEIIRRLAQEKVLGHSTLGLHELHTMYKAAGLIEGTSSFEVAIVQQVAQMYARTGVRVHLDEMPQEKADGPTYRRAVREALENFKGRYGWVLQPLLTPIAIEVLVKPPPPSRWRRGRDLDNIVRRYILPGVMEILNPPSDFAWTVDVRRIREEMPDMASHWDSVLSKLPKSTAVGVTRFDVWRVPRYPEDESPGFVTIGLAADAAGVDSVWYQVEKTIDEWAQSVENHW